MHTGGQEHISRESLDVVRLYPVFFVRVRLRGYASAYVAAVDIHLLLRYSSSLSLYS